MELSIIVPIFNVEEYVVECVESIVNQKTNILFEIILINDGSTDNSREKIKKYSNTNNVTIIDQENLGLSAARNTGLKIAKGKYIIFIDSDDFIEEDFIDKLYKYANENMLDVVFSGYKIFTSKDDKKIYKCIYKNNILLKRDKAIKNLIRKKTFRAEVWDDIYRREFLIENNLFFTENIINEDEDFTLRVLLNAENIGYLNYNGYMYRQREGSITKQKNYYKIIESRIKIINYLIKIFNKENEKINKKLIYWRISCISEWVMRNLYMKDLNYDIENIMRFIYLNGNLKEKIKINIIRKFPKIYMFYSDFVINFKKIIKRVII
ncbi:glycosyltransferase [Clostridium baratii]|uniref:glycosyltransferase n=1 Tax=Clostridium baratii TaxID=1561 RepID=UPI003D344C60